MTSESTIPKQQPKQAGESQASAQGGSTASHLDAQTQLELEAAAFRVLVGHLRERSDVQNIDLMNLSGFCRNCLSKWYAAAANEKGLDIDYDTAREVVYGMPYSEWKSKYQTEATVAQKAEYAAKHDH